MANTFNHAGIGVGDIQRAVDFYRDAFGCRLLDEVFEVTSDGPDGDEAVDDLSSRPFRSMYMANMVTSNGIGFELFQLVDPPLRTAHTCSGILEERYLSYLHDGIRYRHNTSANS